MEMNYEKSVRDEASASYSGVPGTNHTRVSWESPSNIAIVKYWGKRTVQLPTNASLSVTLSHARTRMEVECIYDDTVQGPRLDFQFEHDEAPQFRQRLEKYLEQVTPLLPFLGHARLTVRSTNTFPHSSGIASSASALSALALALCDIEQELFNRPHEDFYRKASLLARLGSGSASRSLYGGMALWGKTSGWSDSSDEYAIPIGDIHPNFRLLHDSILIIESGKKAVSSSHGHALMETNPFAPARFRQAEDNLRLLKPVLRNGDWGGFIDIMENEALTLHAMMMTSSPGYILMAPHTVEALHRIRDFRRETGTNLGFTLDAGANVHILFPESEENNVTPFLNEQLKPLCENQAVIKDVMGDGPERMSVQ